MSSYQIILPHLKSGPSNLLQSLPQKKKSLNLGPKMPDLGIFGLEFENNIVILVIDIKKCLHFGLKMLYLDIFGLEF